jgi:hypothetical protein
MDHLVDGTAINVVAGGVGVVVVHTNCPVANGQSPTYGPERLVPGARTGERRDPRAAIRCANLSAAIIYPCVHDVHAQ